MNFSELTKNSTVLSNEQLKKIRGAEGTCGYSIIIETDRGRERISECGVSHDDAQAAFSMGIVGSHWCCDSCGSSTYCY